MKNIHKNNLDWLKSIGGNWSLFLDRDGVINDEIENGYILHWKYFHFLDGVLQSFPILASRFSHIFIVTNQKGIGKGLMTIEDLQLIHHNMQSEIQKNGGRIDKIYYCTDLDDHSYNRKPNIGMALMAKNDFPIIDFSKSIMVGNAISDMDFGKNAGMFTIFIKSKKMIPENIQLHADAIFNGLDELAKAL